ncbi:MAG: hypothetical protein ACI9KE_000827 [Polyangiales bacterium]|jgi:hypothetical protein
MMSKYPRIVFCSLFVAAGACDCGGEDTMGDSGPGADARTDMVIPVDVPFDVEPTSDDCRDENNRKIFVLTTDLGELPYESHLFRFDPADASYTRIGQVECDVDGSFLRSMAVDRTGNAWATDSRGFLYQVSTTTAACVKSSFATEQEGVRNFGMGYASIGESSAERLYITATGTWWTGAPEIAYRRLAVIDTSALSVETIGELEAPTPANMELTGTGDGRLFGMVVDVRNLRNVITTIEELDPTTGATMASQTVPVEAQSGFAFAQWGGDFWLFTANDSEEARVIQFRFEDASVVNMIDTDLEVPGTIIGAGVSTCAPYDLI